MGGWIRKDKFSSEAGMKIQGMDCYSKGCARGEE